MAYAALLAAKQSGEISYMEFLWKYQHYFPVRTMQLAIHAGVRATLSRQRSRRFRIIRSFRQREWAECECRSALIL